MVWYSHLFQNFPQFIVIQHLMYLNMLCSHVHSIQNIFQFSFNFFLNSKLSVLSFFRIFGGF